jgi:asparagine synthase (glutamine-hydrolysing)
MCGIVGAVAGHGAEPPTRERVALALRSLAHRGPDESGVHSDRAAALGHTRLSIVDLANGQQPMPNEDRSVWTVFNGEIWNHRDLRRRLEAAGHRFETRCDTEVLVHAYEEWGDDLVLELDGMFAFAIWDGVRQRVLLARDRVGKKPLYFATVDGTLVFASDARSIFQVGGIRPALDRAQLAEFLFQRYVGAPRTLFRGVTKLRPGHLLTFDRAHLETRSYWSFPSEASDPLSAEELRQMLLRAVDRRLMSDVPLGIYLSGGVDSAAVLALMREAGAESVASFTIGFDDPLYDERPAARSAAERFATDRHEVVVSGDEFMQALPRLAWYRDEPIAEPTEVPLLLLAEFAGRHVKVVLSGDGGDELFGGYPKYRAERLLRLATGVPALGMRLAAAVMARRPSHREFGRAMETMAISEPLLRWASWFRSFSAVELKRLLPTPLAASAAPETLTEPLRELLVPYEQLDDGKRMLLGDLMTYLPDNMLLRGDKVSMAASVEARMPLLDREIVDRVSGAPAGQRAGIFRAKSVLRSAMADLVPAEVMNQPKRGFRVPVARFLLEDDHRLIDDLILSERCLSRGIFDPDELRNLVGSPERPRPDAHLKLFTIASLELWLRTNVDEIRPQPPASWHEVIDDTATARDRAKTPT